MKDAIKWVILTAILMIFVGGLLWMSVVAIDCWAKGASVVYGGCWRNDIWDALF